MQSARWIFCPPRGKKSLCNGRLLDRLFPVSNILSDRQVKSNGEVKETIQNILRKKHDLQNFRGTAWGTY
jgi:hypothetical protein